MFVTELIVSAIYLILKWVFTFFALTGLFIALNFVMAVVFIVILSLILVGVMNANGNLAKSLPFIGGIEILK